MSTLLNHINHWHSTLSDATDTFCFFAGDSLSCKIEFSIYSL